MHLFSEHVLLFFSAFFQGADFVFRHHAAVSDIDDQDQDVRCFRKDARKRRQQTGPESGRGNLLCR